jgi:hypothetical protein
LIVNDERRRTILPKSDVESISQQAFVFVIARWRAI